MAWPWPSAGSNAQGHGAAGLRPALLHQRPAGAGGGRPWSRRQEQHAAGQGGGPADAVPPGPPSRRAMPSGAIGWAGRVLRAKKEEGRELVKRRD